MPTTRLWRYSPVIPSRSSIISVFILGMWLTSNECFCMVWDGKYCYFFLPVYSAVPALLYKENNFSFSFELSQCLCLRSTGHIYIYICIIYIYFIYILFIYLCYLYIIYMWVYILTLSSSIEFFVNPHANTTMSWLFMSSWNKTVWVLYLHFLSQDCLDSLGLCIFKKIYDQLISFYNKSSSTLWIACFK